MKSTVSFTKSAHSYLCSLMLGWVFLVVMILAAGHQAIAQPATKEAENNPPSYTIEGAVQNAGRFPLDKNFRIKNAIEVSGGLTKDADRKRSEIIRFNKRQKAYYTIYFKADSALSGDPTDNFVLLDKDRIIIHTIRNKIDQGRAEAKKIRQENVFIAGEIANPGSYIYAGEMTVWDLVLKGGGTLKTSYPEQAEILSVLSGAGKTSGTDRKFINLKKAMEGDPAHNVRLRPHDRLVVRSIPEGARPLQTVCVFGEIRLPGIYAITKGERLSSVIRRAGGFGPDAYLRAAVFARERVRELQQSSLEEIAARIERDLSAQNLVIAGKWKSAKDAPNQKTEAEAKMKLLRQVKTIRATGRITVAIIGEEKLKGSPHDIELENGDSLYIPQMPDMVNVLGAVNAEGSYDHEGKLAYRDYIAMAGGYLRTADDTAVFVIKADGSTRRLAAPFFEWNNKWNRLEIGGSSRESQIIDPGDIIVAPERIARPSWLRDIHGITQTLMNNGIIAPQALR